MEILKFFRIDRELNYGRNNIKKSISIERSCTSSIIAQSYSLKRLSPFVINDFKLPAVVKQVLYSKSYFYFHLQNILLLVPLKHLNI